MKLRPVGDRIVVRRADVETQRGGIIIPDSALEKPLEGEVIAVGTGMLLDNGTMRALEVAPGDRILFGKYAGTEVQLEGEDLLILREADVLGVLAAALEGASFERAVGSELPGQDDTDLEFNEDEAEDLPGDDDTDVTLPRRSR